MQEAEDEAGEDEEDKEDKAVKKRKGESAAASQADQITRGSKGIIMPARNAFDFVDRPRRELENDMRMMGQAN